MQHIIFSINRYMEIQIEIEIYIQFYEGCTAIYSKFLDKKLFDKDCRIFKKIENFMFCTTVFIKKDVFLLLK